MSIKRTDFITSVTLGVCTALAAACIAFRFFYLSRPLSYDELYTIASSDPTLSIRFLFSQILLLDINTPLYNLLMYGWNHLFSPVTELSIRLPGLLASLGAIAYAWFAFPKFLGATQRFIFTALLACSHNALFYAQDARCYSFLMLAAVFITLRTVDILHDFQIGQPVCKKQIWLFCMVGLLACYLHYFGAALFFSCAFILLCGGLYYRRPVASLCAGTALTFILFLPWPLYILNANPDVGTQWWVRLCAIRAWEQILQMWMGSLAAAGIGALICLLGVVSGFKTKKLSLLKAPSFLVPFLCLVMVILFTLSFKNFVNLLVDRYFLALLPCVLLLLTYFLSELIERHRPMILALPVLLFFCIWPQSLDYAFSGEKFLAGTKPATQFILRDLRPNSFLVYLEGIPYPPHALNQMFNYYLQRPGSNVTQSKLSKLTLARSFLERKHPIILIPVCSQLSMLNLTINFDAVALRAFPFASDSCVVEVGTLQETRHD